MFICGLSLNFYLGAATGLKKGCAAVSSDQPQRPDADCGWCSEHSHTLVGNGALRDLI